MLELKPTTGKLASLFRLLSSLLPSLFMYSVPFSVCFPSRDLLRVCLSSEAFLACVHSVFCLLVKSGISASAVAVCDLVPVICLPQLGYNAPGGGRLLLESQIRPVNPAGSEVLRVGTGAHYRKAPEEADCSAKAALALEQIVILRRGGTFCSVQDHCSE